jgi:hypothetical protein
LANNNAPFGLRPINDNGTPFSGQGRLVRFPTGIAANVFLGDPLVYTGGGDAYGVPDVGLASAGATNVVAGSFIGLTNGPQAAGSAAFTVTRDLPVYVQSGVLAYGLVADDPNQLWAIQEDGIGGAIAAGTGPGANGNLISGSGSTATGYSGWLLDSSTVSSSANPTYQLRIMGLLRGVQNAVGNYAVWVVRLNLPQIWGLGGV